MIFAWCIVGLSAKKNYNMKTFEIKTRFRQENVFFHRYFFNCVLEKIIRLRSIELEKSEY